MSSAEHLPNILQRVALRGQQYDVVVHQVSSFAEEKVPVVILGFDDEFNGFFTYFLGNSINATGQELAGVAFFARVVPPMLDGAFEVVQEFSLVDFAPTGVCAGMASRAIGAGLYEEAVLVAVGGDADEVEKVLTAFSLSPQALLRTTEEGDFTRFQGFVECFPVHIALHQHHTGVGILYDGGQEAVG